MRGRREAETERQERGEMRDRDGWKEEPAGRVELGGGGQTAMQIGKQRDRDTEWGRRVVGGGTRRAKQKMGKGERPRGGGDCSPNMQDACDGTATVHSPAPSTPATGMLPAAGPSAPAETPELGLTPHPEGGTRGPVQVGQVGTVAPLSAWGGGCRRHFCLFSGVHVPCL